MRRKASGAFPFWEPEPGWVGRAIAILVNSLHPPPPVFVKVRILKGFKASVFGSADSKRVTRLFFGSADSTGFRLGVAFGGRTSEAPRDVPSVRIAI